MRAFDTNNEWIKPRTKHFLCRELFITQNKRIFIELAFWMEIRNKNSLTIEPNANLISFNDKVRFALFARDSRVIGMKHLYTIADWLYFHMWNSCTQFWLAV